MLNARLLKTLRDYTLDIQLQAQNGEILVLMGENGAGKTTVLQLLSGLMIPDDGLIEVNGERWFDATSHHSRRVEMRKLGYLIQHTAVFPHMSVFDNIAFGLRAAHLPENVVSQRVHFWLKRTNLCSQWRIKAVNLSGGQKQRVALARAFAIEPCLLLLDEPLTALDDTSQHIIKETILQSVKERQIPCIMVTHSITDANTLGDRICCMRQGTITWEGTPHDHEIHRPTYSVPHVLERSNFIVSPG